MKIFRIILLLCLFSLQLHHTMAQDKKVYSIVISFQSMCCGVPSDIPVKNFIRSFKKQYKIKKITASRIGPLGREGEYDLAFGLRELSKKQAISFVKRIKAIKKLPKDPGSWSFEEKKAFDLSALPGRASIVEEVF